jgi:hypothetical protein
MFGAILAQTPQLQASSARQARTLLDRIRSEAIALQREIDRSRYDNSANNADDRVSSQLSTIGTSAINLRRGTYSYSSNVNSATEFNNLLDSANRVNRILNRNAMTTRVNSLWSPLRTDISTLAGYYGMTANWDNGGNNGGWNNNNNNNGGWNNAPWNDRVTGTYRLNASQSDVISDVIDRSLNSYSSNDRDNQRRMLERRLASPEVIVIQKSGRSVTMGSSNAAQVTFDADGVAHTETNPRGRTVTTPRPTIILLSIIQATV